MFFGKFVLKAWKKGNIFFWIIISKSFLPWTLHSQTVTSYCLTFVLWNTLISISFLVNFKVKIHSLAWPQKYQFEFDDWNLILLKWHHQAKIQDVSLNFSSTATLNFSTPTVEDRELEMLIIASIQTLKRGNKKCGKDEVFWLFRDSVADVTKETFDKLLELLIQNQSFRLSIVRNRECLLLPKENQKLI